MASPTRRLISLVLVFAAAFAVVTGLRVLLAGGSVFGWSPHRVVESPGAFRPEPYQMSDKAPLDLSDVGLLARLNDEYAKLTRAVIPSVVSINTETQVNQRVMDYWGRTHLRRYAATGQGSGVIVTREGHVLTNHHVVAGQEKIRVTLHNGKVFPARLIGEDKFLDIAVLRIEGKEVFQPLKLGDSSTVEVGQMVFAVGNPFGLGETVTQGIISAKERSISDGQRDLFQTDAAINPGNSGGPLVNLRGEIIGINVAIYSPDKENPGFQGVGFSIPSNDVRDSMVEILERGQPLRGYLGVQMKDLDPLVRSALRYDGESGSVVVGVMPGSPAEKAGLQQGDVIMAYDGKQISSLSQLFAMVQATKIDRSVSMEVWRKGKVMQLAAVITESPASSDSMVEAGDASSAEADLVKRVLLAMGIEVRDLTVSERMRGYRGVVVALLSPDGLAQGVLERGDLIVGINGARVTNATDFFMQLVSSAAVGETSLWLLRSGETMKVTLPIVPAK